MLSYEPIGDKNLERMANDAALGHALQYIERMYESVLSTGGFYERVAHEYFIHTYLSIVSIEGHSLNMWKTFKKHPQTLVGMRHSDVIYLLKYVVYEYYQGKMNYLFFKEVNRLIPIFRKKIQDVVKKNEKYSRALSAWDKFVEYMADTIKLYDREDYLEWIEIEDGILKARPDVLS